ncbi:MAG: DUF881 domain-containing protein [Actinomycetes bacterium]
MHSAPRPARTAAEARLRLLRTLKPQLSRTQAMITVLFILLGFATTAALRGSSADTLLSNARQSDLVSVLDDLAQREARLQSEISRLETSRETLLGGDQYQALNEAKLRAKALGLLAGTEPVLGSGVSIVISGNLTASTLIDAMQELRDAGATAIQISDSNLDVRIVANTWFSTSPSGVTVSGTALKVPITLSVIGDSSVIVPAIQIPGGLVDTVGSGGGTVNITSADDINISAVVPMPVS